VSVNESSDDRTSVIRAAIEMVMRLSEGGEEHREEVSRIVLKIADQGDHDANALANLTIAVMGANKQKQPPA
jgi:mannitol/fructose-specific phosphotransferase system IIA component